ncbi:MAG: pirin family protein [Flavobacterium sp.]|nr:pirin family protein [Flavobacterium sp.]
MKNSVLHKATTRGLANHGWLNSRHTFSFAQYYNHDRMNFGVLRVLNDDIVAAGMGFGSHPHNNMEIISIPLEGDLKHADSMGNQTIIKKGDVQILSAGTGIVHSEMNANNDREVKFLQIWVIPNKQNITPSYDQITIDQSAMINAFLLVVSPVGTGKGVGIHQDAWFHIGKLDAGTDITYNFKIPSNGLYVFVLKGNVEADGQNLDERDGLGIWNTEKISFKALEDSELLLMEIPMTINN